MNTTPRRGGVQFRGQSMTDWRNTAFKGITRCAVCNVKVEDSKRGREKHCASAGHTGQVNRYKARKSAIAQKPSYRS